MGAGLKGNASLQSRWGTGVGADRCAACLALRAVTEDVPAGSTLGGPGAAFLMRSPRKERRGRRRSWEPTEPSLAQSARSLLAKHWPPGQTRRRLPERAGVPAPHPVEPRWNRGRSASLRERGRGGRARKEGGSSTSSGQRPSCSQTNGSFLFTIKTERGAGGGSGYLLEYLFGIVRCHTKEFHYVPGWGGGAGGREALLSLALERFFSREKQ